MASFVGIKARAVAASSDEGEPSACLYVVARRALAVEVLLPPLDVFEVVVPSLSRPGLEAWFLAGRALVMGPPWLEVAGVYLLHGQGNGEEAYVVVWLLAQRNLKKPFQNVYAWTPCTLTFPLPPTWARPG